MSIQIKLIDGKVPPLCLTLLLDLGGHKDVCSQCYNAYTDKTPDWCVTGLMILEELGQQPEVSQVD